MNERLLALEGGRPVREQPFDYQCIGGNLIGDEEMALVIPEFADELERFGVDTTLECFNCGTCAAICPLIYEHFPRKMIRYVMTMKTRLMQLSVMWTRISRRIFSSSHAAITYSTSSN